MQELVDRRGVVVKPEREYRDAAERGKGFREGNARGGRKGAASETKT